MSDELTPGQERAVKVALRLARLRLDLALALDEIDAQSPEYRPHSTRLRQIAGLEQRTKETP